MTVLGISVVIIMCLVVFLEPTGATTVKYWLTVDLLEMQIGNVTKAVVGFNNSLVGPTLRCRQGDTMDVRVTNNLHSDSTSVHWHGIANFGNPWMDGVPLGSQCAILPAASFRYKFTCETSGTFWYHSHYDLQRNDAAFGPFIVDPPLDRNLPFHYDQEIILTFSDWYKDYYQMQLIGLLSRSFRWVDSPQSHLINGALNQRIVVEEGKTYLIRTISAAALSWFSYSIPHHEVTIVESQGTWVTPYKTTNLKLNIGERISFLLKADRPGCYQIDFFMLERVGKMNGAFYLEYAGLDCFNKSYTTWEGDAQEEEENSLTASHMDYPVPNATRQIHVKFQQRTDKEGRYNWHVNGKASQLNSHTPILLSTYLGMTNELPDALIIDIYEGEVIDLIFENLPRYLDLTTESHPVHGHGHRFWLLGSGTSPLPLDQKNLNLNLVDPISIDTWTVPKYGWTYLRFEANNPGVWVVHCHISFHLPMGMFFFLRYKGGVPAPPPFYPICGSPTAVAAYHAFQDSKISTSITSYHSTLYSLLLLAFVFLL